MKKDIKKIKIREYSTISDAIKKLNESGLKVLCVVDSSGKLLGTLSDGDIRRGLVVSPNLNVEIEKIYNKNPVKILKQNYILSNNKLLNLRIPLIPIVDKHNKIIDYISKQDNVDLDNTFYIIAGGRGKRMMPLTLVNPKPLIPYMGESSLSRLLKKVKQEGFFNIYISINYLANKIKSKYEDGKKIGLKIKYIHEKKSLGTAGSLYYFRNKKINFPLIATNADLITDLNFSDILNFHKTHNADFTLAVKHHEYQNPFGVIYSKGIKLDKIIEKPVHTYNINAGVYVISKTVLQLIKKNSYYDITTLISDLLTQNKKVLVFPLYENWKDLQSPKDIQN